MYEKETLKVNVWKSEVMAFESKEAEVVDFTIPYWMNVPAVGRYKILLEEEMEEVKEFKYLGTVLCKHGDMEREREL